MTFLLKKDNYEIFNITNFNVKLLLTLEFNLRFNNILYLYKVYYS